MRISFVRHGQSEANIQGIFSNGMNKHGLTQTGREQAGTLAEMLKDKGITRIYASPLLRARQTAEIIAGKLGLPVELSGALGEHDIGDLDDRSDPDSHAIFSQAVDAWLVRGELGHRIPGGESLLDMRARFLPFLEQLVNDPQNRSENILLVGHGGLYRFILPLALRNISFAFSRDNGMRNTAVVVAETSPHGLVCSEWCGQPMEAAADPTSSADGAQVELVLRFNDALNAGNTDEMMTLMTPDCIFENTDPAPDGRRYEGQAAVRAFWEDFFRSSTRPHIEIEQIFAAGGNCAMRWTYTWTGLNGQAGRIRGVDIYRIKGGLIAAKLSYVKG